MKKQKSGSNKTELQTTLRGILRALFSGFILSLREDITWPPRSPDLSPCDFFFLRTLKGASVQTSDNIFSEFQVFQLQVKNKSEHEPKHDTRFNILLPIIRVLSQAFEKIVHLCIHCASINFNLIYGIPDEVIFKKKEEISRQYCKKFHSPQLELPKLFVYTTGKKSRVT
ncbi:UNVERIFIED_CONTAM: hypothetical protein NCL1_55903 [Trichonephila clavipes]